MHYGTNQKFGGPGQDLGACAPWPQPKTATVRQPTSERQRTAGGLTGKDILLSTYRYKSRCHWS